MTADQTQASCKLSMGLEWKEKQQRSLKVLSVLCQAGVFIVGLGRVSWAAPPWWHHEQQGTNSLSGIQAWSTRLPLKNNSKKKKKRDKKRVRESKWGYRTAVQQFHVVGTRNTLSTAAQQDTAFSKIQPLGWFYWLFKILSLAGTAS